MATIGKYGKIIFSDKDIQFIKDNFQSMTNDAIAASLGLKKTKVRTFAYNLGLQKMKLEYWPDEATAFLKDNYKTMGNVEIVKHFSTKFPKEKGWSTSHIDKKLEQLNLKRNKQDWYNIIENNRQKGSYGIPNPKKQGKKIKAIVTFKDQKFILEPGQTKQDLFELILTNKVKPIKDYDTTI